MATPGASCGSPDVRRGAARCKRSTRALKRHRSNAERVFARDLNVLGKARDGEIGIARAAGVEDFQMLLRRHLQPLQQLAEARAKQPEPRRVEAVALADDFVLLEVDLGGNRGNRLGSARAMRCFTAFVSSSNL